MLVDDLDALSTHDQGEMFNAFKDVIDRSSGQEKNVSVRILASCRSNESFAIRAFAQEATVDIAEGNSGDMALQVAAALVSMPDWTAEERGEAQAKVLSMAGSRFGYVSASIIINIVCYDLLTLPDLHHRNSISTTTVPASAHSKARNSTRGRDGLVQASITKYTLELPGSAAYGTNVDVVLGSAGPCQRSHGGFLRSLRRRS